MTSTKLEAGVIYSLLSTTRDLGYGEELIDGEYVWTGEIDMWGKYTFRAFDGSATIYLFSDEIGTPEPVFA